MNDQLQIIAEELRSLAEALDRAKVTVASLPPCYVDDEASFALFLDAPRVALALCNVAGCLDPEGEVVELAGASKESGV